MTNILFIMFFSVFAENIVLFLGLGAKDSVNLSEKRISILPYGGILAAITTVSSGIVWILQKYLVKPLEIGYLKGVLHVFVVAAVSFVMFLIFRAAFSDAFLKVKSAFGSVGLVTFVLGVLYILGQSEFGFVESLIFALASAVGFVLVTLIFSEVRERIEISDIPESFSGLPILIIAAGLVSLVFSGFAGVKF